MNYSAEQNRIDKQNEYEQLFGADYDGFQNNNVEEKATVINNQINNDAILYDYTQNNMYGSSYVQEKIEDEEYENNITQDLLKQNFIIEKNYSQKF